MSKEKKNFVESLRDMHRGKHIWIIGTGKSLDDFSDKFFNNKVSIGINGAIFKYPNSTWWFGHHEPWREYLRDERPDLLNKAIFCYPFPGTFPHNTTRIPEDFFGELTSIPYWLYFRDSTVMSKKEMKTPICDIINKKQIIPFRACKTVLHIAMEIAFLMGASKITLVGCENRKFENQDSHGDVGREYPWNYNWGAQHPIVREATKWLADLLIEEGVDTKRYYNSNTEFYTKGYEEI